MTSMRRISDLYTHSTAWSFAKTNKSSIKKLRKAQKAEFEEMIAEVRKETLLDFASTLEENQYEIFESFNDYLRWVSYREERTLIIDLLKKKAHGVEDNE